MLKNSFYTCKIITVTPFHWARNNLHRKPKQTNTSLYIIRVLRAYITTYWLTHIQYNLQIRRAQHYNQQTVIFALTDNWRYMKLTASLRYRYLTSNYFAREHFSSTEHKQKNFFIKYFWHFILFDFYRLHAVCHHTKWHIFFFIHQSTATQSYFTCRRMWH